MKPLSFFVLFFTLACERSFITTHSIASRSVIGPKIYCLQVCPCIFQPGNITGWGSVGVKQSVTVQAVVLPVLASIVFEQIVTAVSAVSVPSKLDVTEILPV